MYILSPQAIRERTKQVYELALNGKTNFKVNINKLDDVSEYVLKVIYDNYPSLEIPFHSRHGHLNAGKINRLKNLESKLSTQDKKEIARTMMDLVVVSVLLDAGAGDKWKYKENSTGQTHARSEGLAVASYHMFEAGAFSGDSKNLYKADIKGLKNISAQALEKHFQVNSDTNPLIGIEGRVHLLNALAKVLQSNPNVFKTGRVGDMYDYLLESHGNTLKAVHVLDFVLKYFADIWPARIKVDGQSLGDVWSYSGFGKAKSEESFVPFHKLSQWLTYSLLVPIIDSGVKVVGVDELTGLAEYRNGGLIIDSGLVELRDTKLLSQKFAPDSDLVIEWRALTVVLLDLIGEKIRNKLKKSKEELPLAKVLEGGTWHAGRKIAKEKRPNGEPPINIISDGTVF